MSSWLPQVLSNPTNYGFTIWSLFRVKDTEWSQNIHLLGADRTDQEHKSDNNRDVLQSQSDLYPVSLTPKSLPGKIP